MLKSGGHEVEKVAWQAMAEALVALMVTDAGHGHAPTLTDALSQLATLLTGVHFVFASALQRE